MRKILILGAVTLGIISLGGCGNDEFNSWTNDCLQMHGIVARTHAGAWSDRYECFVDNKIVQVPGWEGS